MRRKISSRRASGESIFVSFIKPAYHIPATDEELRLIGEPAAIQGQIEWMMQHTLIFSLGTLPDAARAILGSAGVGTEVDPIGCNTAAVPVTGKARAE
ncbi:MAG: hypothetical protein ACREEL_13940 [Stellaceae bacterium]